MEKVTISKNTLEILTREVISIWECDYVEMTDTNARRIAIALDEAIEATGLQPELDRKAEQEREEQARLWKERQAQESGAN